MELTTISSTSSGRKTWETGRNQERSVQEHHPGAKHIAHEEERKQELQAIQGRRPSMDRGYKPEDPVPHSKTRAEMIRTLQGAETDVGSSIPRGDTETLEDSQCVSCKPNHAVQGNRTARAEL